MTATAAGFRADLARSSALSFVGSVCSALMGLALVILLGRMLGDAGSGIVFQVIGIFSIALGFARFGMDSAAIWILPRQMADDPSRVRQTVWFLLGVSALVGVLTSLVLLLGARLMLSQQPADPVAAGVALISWALPVASVLLTALSANRAMGRVTAYVLLGNVALPTLRPVLVALAIAAGGGTVAVTLMWAAPLVPVALGALLFLAVQLHRQDAPRPVGRLPLKFAGRTVRYALPRVVSSSLEQLLIWLAVVVVGFIAGPAAAGVYGAASRFIAAGMIVDTALRVVVSPMFSRLQHRGSSVELEAVYRTATIWLVLFSTPVYILLAVFAPVILTLLGDGFADGGVVLVIMCSGAIVTFLAGNIHSVLLMSGRSGLAAMNKAIAIAINVALLFALTPVWGIAGAAGAWALASALDAALATIEVRRILRIRISPVPGLYPLAVAAVTVAVPAVLTRMLLGATWPALVVAVVTGGTLLLAWCRFDRHRLHLDDIAIPLIGRGRR